MGGFGEFNGSSELAESNGTYAAVGFEPDVVAFAPGRTELAGNHTDHQGGKVLTGTIDVGIEISLRANGDGKARLKSQGFEDVEIDLPVIAGTQIPATHDLAACDVDEFGLEPVPAETGTTAALVRGVIAGCLELGIPVRGFDAIAKSSIPSGGGLSSSAAFELALAVGLDTLFGSGDTQKIKLAKMAQRVEREYFGKPCGLMDQAAIALGGIVAMDFADASNPCVRRIDCDFEKLGYAICLLDTKCDHSRFQDAYAQVATDMHDVARYLGKDVLSQVDETEFLSRLGDVREHLGDRAAMRAIHYYNESHLVDARIDALENGSMARFVELTARSGASSAQYLANVLCPGANDQTPMAVLAMADLFFSGAANASYGAADASADAGRADAGNSSASNAAATHGSHTGACRIHGGGFGGSVQAFVPLAQVDQFINHMQQILGPESCKVVKISNEGAVARWM